MYIIPKPICVSVQNRGGTFPGLYLLTYNRAD
jgi:hypothetical protein